MIVEVDSSIIADNIQIYNTNNCIKYFAIEEMSELQKELTKDLRQIGDTENLISEVADVYYVLSMLKQLYNISDEDISKRINSKQLRARTKIDAILNR